MQEAGVSVLTTWQTFYSIIGTAAATLTGLIFVVITLIVGLRVQVSAAGGAIAAFSAPVVFHFGAALLVAAILSAPWPALWNAGLLLGLAGLVGVTYVIIVLRRTLRQTDYQPVLEDWLFHTILPLASYTAFVVTAILLPGHAAPALFIVAAATVLLLFIGLHNSWDNMTFLVIEYGQREDKSEDEHGTR